MMKKKSLLLLMGAAFVAVSLNSCRTSSGADGYGSSVNPDQYLFVYDLYNTELADEPIEYIIDITTAAGAAKLNGLTLKQARELALREAIIKHKCASIYQPQYTHLMKGKKVLRIRVYGFPLVYKNKE